jgi:hypothetical protein
MIDETTLKVPNGFEEYDITYLKAILKSVEDRNPGVDIAKNVISTIRSLETIESQALMPSVDLSQKVMSLDVARRISATVRTLIRAFISDAKIQEHTLQSLVISLSKEGHFTAELTNTGWVLRAIPPKKCLGPTCCLERVSEEETYCKNHRCSQEGCHDLRESTFHHCPAHHPPAK